MVEINTQMHFGKCRNKWTAENA